MKQISLHKAFGKTERTPVVPNNGALPCYDIFCGGGGWSLGAEMAGCKVVFGCDSDAEILEQHRRNFPQAMHLCAELPNGDIPWPTDGSPFHAHFSPPCTKFSRACTVRTKRQRVEQIEDATDLLEWSLRTALTCGATSWSLEEVFTGVTRDKVEEIRKEFPNRMRYAIVDFSELGVPQTRRRLIAGSPELIAGLLRKRDQAKKVSIADALTPPDGVLHLHTGTCVDAKKPETWGDNLWNVTSVGPTVLAEGALWWIRLSDNGGPPTKQVLTSRENATLQTFPHTYKLTDNRKLARRIVGNAVPPLVSQLMMRGAECA